METSRMELVKGLPIVVEELSKKEVSHVLSLYNSHNLNHDESEEMKAEKDEVRRNLTESIINAALYATERVDEIIAIAKRAHTLDLQQSKNIFYGLAYTPPDHITDTLDTMRLYEGTIEEGHISVKFARIMRGNARDSSDCIFLSDASYNMLSSRIKKLFQENAEKLKQTYKEPKDLEMVQEVLFSVARDTFHNQPDEHLINRLTSFVLNPQIAEHIRIKKGKSYKKFQSLYDEFSGTNAGIHASHKPKLMRNLAYFILDK